MNIPQDKSEYFPNFPIKKLQFLLIIIGLVVLLYSSPVIFVGDSGSEIASQGAVVDVRDIDESGYSYGNIDVDIVVEADTSTDGKFQFKGSVEFMPYGDMDESLEAPLYVGILIAPASWSSEKVANDGEFLFYGETTLSPGDTRSYEHETSIPESFNPTGIGPNKVVLYHYAESNAGYPHFEPIGYYTIHRPFWDRPRAWGLLSSILLILGITLTFNQSVRSVFSIPFNRYAERKWYDDLTSISEKLDNYFKEYAQFEREESVISQDIQSASHGSLKEYSSTLEQFGRLYESVSNDKLDNLSIDTTSIRTSAAQAYWNGNVQRANHLNKIASGLIDGLHVDVRGERYDVSSFFGDSIYSISSSADQEISETADQISEFIEAKQIVEKWSQLISPENNRTKLALKIDGEWIEPIKLWNDIEQALSIGFLNKFNSHSSTIEEFASLTQELRTNSTQAHPLASGNASTRTSETAKEAVRNADIKTLAHQIDKSQARIAKQEVEELFKSVDLTYSGIAPNEIEEKLKRAWNTGDYSLIKSIRDETLSQLDTTWRPEDLLDLSPKQFEEVLGLLYQRKGYSVSVTQLAADRGVDVIAEDHHRSIAIQAKRYDPDGAGNVSGPEVRNAIGATVQFDSDVCIVVTSSGFTEDARRAARETYSIEVELLTGGQVAKMLSKHQVPKP